MNSDRWKKISGIFKIALDLEPADRQVFLRDACAGDAELLDEVKSLLVSHNQADSLERNALEILAETATEKLVGQKIANYEVERLIGVGGMGEVYLARDERLDRQVALKLLAPQYITETEQVERFQQEAKALSALNHPNILTVHDFGVHQNRPYFVSEYIAGETLRLHLSKGDLPLEKKLDVAIQVARGLAVAHEAGIVHRDIKPENLIIREDGYVKILDFGLAKFAPEVALDKFKTTGGFILGTVNYMSPEQASGLDFDHRTDIWSLGVVIFEMLLGKTPFDAETPTAVLASILKSAPPNIAIDGFNQIVQKALQKNREHRYATSRELLNDLMTLRSRGLNLEQTSEIDASNLPTVISSSLHFAPNNLTSPPTGFVGRDAEVASVVELLTDDKIRLITLTGAGGTGKSRLALRVATMLLDEFTDGLYFVPLATITNADLVASSIAQTLDIKEAGNLNLVDRLKENLRERKVLLILDNFEQLLGASQLVSELLSSASRLKILITSRAVLRLRGEHEFFVPTLSVPDQAAPLEKLAGNSAIQLFVQSARAVKSDFRLNQENSAAVIEICQRLDGLPLALELAAARVKLFNPQVLAKKLSLKILTGGAKDLPAKQQTMRDAIAWSYELLDDVEKKLLRHLTVFVGGFTFESAESVIDLPDIFDGISSLVDKSLLQKREQTNGDSRFFMLMTIKEFGSEQLELGGESEVVRSRHLDYFHNLATEHCEQLRGTNAAVSVDILEDDHKNILAALDFAHDTDPEKAMSLAATLSQFWILRNYYSEGLAYLEKTLAAAAETPTRTRGEVLKNAGTILRMQGKFLESRAFYQVSLEVGIKIDDPEVKSFSRDGLAIVEIYAKNYPLSQTLLEESLRDAKLTNDEQKTVNPLNLLGEVHRIQNNNEAALIFYQNAYQVLQKTDVNPTTAVVLNNLGYVNDELGNYEDAFYFQKKCISVCLQLKNRRVAITSLDGIASIAAKTGDFERGAIILGASTNLRKTLGFTKTPTDIPALERAIDSIKKAIGESRYNELFTTGQAMDFDEVIEFALDQKPRQ